MLCNLVLNGQIDVLRDSCPGRPARSSRSSPSPSIPRKTTASPEHKKAAYLASYERDAPGWHFLTDHEGNVEKLAEQIGFHYKFDQKIGQYAHAAAIFVLTPEGMISRYLYGVKFKPLDMRLALTEAAEEKFGVTEQADALTASTTIPSPAAYVPVCPQHHARRRSAHAAGLRLCALPTLAP